MFRSTNTAGAGSLRPTRGPVWRRGVFGSRMLSLSTSSGQGMLRWDAGEPVIGAGSPPAGSGLLKAAHPFSWATVFSTPVGGRCSSSVRNHYSPVAMVSSTVFRSMVMVSTSCRRKASLMSSSASRGEKDTSSDTTPKSGDFGYKHPDRPGSCLNPRPRPTSTRNRSARSPARRCRRLNQSLVSSALVVDSREKSHW